MARSYGRALITSKEQGSRVFPPRGQEPLKELCPMTNRRTDEARSDCQLTFLLLFFLLVFLGELARRFDLC